MAESLTREGPIDVLESAVGVLRQAGFGALVLHWTGSIPFALAALVFWKQVGDPRTSDAACALGALALALLLLWMNCWRAVFAGRVQRQLIGDPALPRTWQGFVHLIAVQSIASASKLVVLPLAALILFPLPAVMAFYRNLAVLADRGSSDPRATFARARRLARFQPEQSWLIVPLILFFGLAVCLNVLAAMGSLPQLVRILSGYESAFSRSGMFFITNPMFLMLVLAVTWVLFDPFVQAVYCLRCYQAESLETGEDVRTGIRRLRAGVAIPVAMLLAAIAVPCRADLQPADLRKASAIAIQSPEYNWRLPPPPAGAKDTPWIVSLTDRIVASTKSFRDAVGNLVERFFNWLGGQLGGPQPQGGALPARGLHWTVYLVIAVAGLAGILMALRVLRSRRVKTEPVAVDGIGSIRLDADDLTPDRLPEDQWLELAERSLLEENLRFALRAFYLASLAWMGRAEFISIHPGKTNREYELELKRRLRTHPEARALFGTNVAAFERAWYGLHDVATEEIHEFRQRVGEMKSILPAARGSAA